MCPKLHSGQLSIEDFHVLRQEAEKSLAEAEAEAALRMVSGSLRQLVQR
jgi:hypothetical protein